MASLAPISMTPEQRAVAMMQQYARQIYERALAGQKPGAALANYERSLRELDEIRGER